MERAEEFIRSTQDDFGEFRSYLCDHTLVHCNVDSTPFISTFVVQSLRETPGRTAAKMRERALEFLASEMLPGGLWRFWTFRAPYVPILMPDLDDTVTAADALQDAGMLKEDNRELVKLNVDVRGRFMTWFLPTEHSPAFDFDPASRLRIREVKPARWNADRFFSWIRRQEFLNATDPTVNANVLLYLREEIWPVCQFLNDSISRGEESLYYLGLPARYYLYGRAYRGGVRCLDPSRDRIVRDLLREQKPDGSFGSAQDTAFALNALEDFGYKGDAVTAGVQSLLANQRSDGSWKDEFFFKENAFCENCHYWRSPALSSAAAIEALIKTR